MAGHIHINVSIRMACLVLLTAVACVSRAGQQEPDDSIGAIVVSSERTGPGLWHIHGHEGEAWLLGTVSPLPRDITWRSTQVEQILGGANLVLVSKPLEIGIIRELWLFITQRDLLMVPGGRSLRDVLSPDLYARFARLRALYSSDPDKWSRYRPIIATAFLERAALHQVGLSARLNVGNEVRALARKHGVRVEEIKIGAIGDFLGALKTMSPDTENKCVVAALGTIETGLPRLVSRAAAWVTGDIPRIQSLPQPADVDACLAALDGDTRAADLLARIRGTWVAAIEDHLRRGEVTLAVVNMDLLLQPGGVLDRLRSDGYSIDAP
jgi:uncharacterized protein YbaP (TraB family)